jgi:murein DD-endopeptidase MepM/ murein hydrolase activator NlpD
MQVIIISSNSKAHRHWHLTRSMLLILLMAVVALIGFSSYSFANWMHNNNISPAQFKSSTASPVSSNHTVSDNNSPDQDESVTNFYARQLGGLQAETIRLRMFSERLAAIAGFDSTAFSLSEHPSLGGIEQDGMPLSSEALERGIQQLSDELRDQDEALASLEQYLLTEDTITASIPTGKPVKEGWVSSFYGYRIDPFTGKKTFHEGLDIAGKSGSEVLAVADGIVTWVGERGGYGGLVEVDHGNGYVTRYAHNKTIKVKKGDRVGKGETLALMGSTGRSTGPHVHFEVLRDGQHANPYNFIK